MDSPPHSAPASDDTSQEREALRRHVIASATHGVLIVDNAHRVVEVNDAMCRLLGYTADQLIGRHTLNFITEAGKATSLQQQAELQLAATVFSDTLEAIMITDADNRIISVNRAFTSVTGYSADEIIGTSPPLVSASHHNAEFREQLREELFNTGKPRPVINYGVGVPDAVAKLIAARNEQHRIYQTIEHGTYGGTLMDGVLFGYARNATAMLDAATQFDFYGGGGLDVAFLGFGEFDETGSVNVSRLGGVTVGPGGFIDIAQNAKKVVFCGTLAAKGVKLATGDGQMRVLQQGAVQKLVKQVDQITFSGPQSVVRGQEVLYLTERASFRLTPEGIELFEIAPGIDLQRDVLDQMAFAPRVAQPLATMAATHFLASD